MSADTNAGHATAVKLRGQPPRPLRLLALALLLTASLWAWGRPGGLLGVGRCPSAQTALRSGAGDDLFSTPGALFGPVRKAGPLAPRHWLKQHAANQLGIYQDYLSRHPYDAERGEAAHPPPSGLRSTMLGGLVLPEPQPVAYPQCQVWVNHEYRMLYLRHPKAGSTSLLHWFRGCARAAKAGGRSAEGCGELVRLEPTLSESEAERLFRDYFVFTSVRNPYDRAVSQFKMLRRTMPAKPECEDLTSWDAFCAFPPTMGLACRARPQCCVMPESFALSHLVSQAGCMLTEDGGLAVDFVLRAGALDEERQALYDAINARRPAGTPALRAPPPEAAKRMNVAATCDSGWRETELWQWQGRNHTTLAPKEQYCSTAEYYGPRHPRCMAQLSAFYAADVELVLGGRAPAGSGGGAAAARRRDG